MSCLPTNFHAFSVFPSSFRDILLSSSLDPTRRNNSVLTSMICNFFTPHIKLHEQSSSAIPLHDSYVFRVLISWTKWQGSVGMARWQLLKSKRTKRSLKRSKTPWCAILFFLSNLCERNSDFNITTSLPPRTVFFFFISQIKSTSTNDWIVIIKQSMLLISLRKLDCCSGCCKLRTFTKTTQIRIWGHRWGETWY